MFGRMFVVLMVPFRLCISAIAFKGVTTHIRGYIHLIDKQKGRRTDCSGSGLGLSCAGCPIFLGGVYFITYLHPMGYGTLATRSSCGGGRAFTSMSDRYY